MALPASPAAARAAPFLVFVVITMGQSWFGGAAPYWIYLIKTLSAAATLWAVFPRIPELKWVFSWEAFVVGIGVFGIWVGLDSFYPKLGGSTAIWNPFLIFGQNSTAGWCFVAIRLAGATLLVPMIEEVFFRSLLYRYVFKVDWQSVPLGTFAWLPFLATSVLFGGEHREWLAGILCGLAYQGLVCGKKRLGDAVTAHAVTNLLLGLWVVWKGAWHFW
jgi:CAAX prenyl protease-like protein